jgi:radical SAM superfamily enzyme YgiQ (UPF0313 family)
MIMNDYEVKILDANADDMSRDRVRTYLKDFNPDVIGVSVLANAYKTAAFEVCEIGKACNPRTVTVIGGVFPTTRPESAMESPFIDYGVMGEGEYVFPELLDFIFRKKDSLPGEGVILRTADGGIRPLPQTKFIRDLDALPLPEYSLIDYTKYSMHFRKSVDAPRALPYGKIITSRGCPFGCVFCQVENIAGRTTRFKSVDRVIEEIGVLVEKYGIKSIEFEDDNFLGNIPRSKELFKKMIAKDWGLKWNAMNVSVFLLNEEILDLMKASGCQYLSMAIESGSPRVLKEIIHKPVNLDHAKKIADYARSIGIDTTSLFVIGFPGETWEEIRQTIRFAEELDTDYVKINVATAFPGTKLHKLAVDMNALDEKFNFDCIEWGKAGISTDEFTADQLSILRAFEWDRLNFSSRKKKEKVAQMMGLSPDELERIRKSTVDIRIGNQG